MPVEGDRLEEVAVLIVVLDLQWQELVVVFVAVLVSGEFDGEILPARARARRRRARKRARGRGRDDEGSSCLALRRVSRVLGRVVRVGECEGRAQRPNYPSTN
jgi:hypothetical protein